MPQMGVSVSEGTIVEWRKQPGDWVEYEEPLVDISTDKIDTEVPSPAAGRLSEIVVDVGTTVDVGTVLARIATDARPGEAHASEHGAGNGNGAAPTSEAAAATGETPAPATESPSPEPAAGTPDDAPRRHRPSRRPPRPSPPRPSRPPPRRTTRRAAGTAPSCRAWRPSTGSTSHRSRGRAAAGGGGSRACS